MQDAACMRGCVVVGLSSMLAYRFGRHILDIPMAAHRSAAIVPPWRPAVDLTLQILAQLQVRSPTPNPVLIRSGCRFSW